MGKTPVFGHLVNKEAVEGVLSPQQQARLQRTVRMGLRPVLGQWRRFLVNLETEDEVNRVAGFVLWNVVEMLKAGFVKDED